MKIVIRFKSFIIILRLDETHSEYTVAIETLTYSDDHININLCFKLHYSQSRYKNYSTPTDSPAQRDNAAYITCTDISKIEKLNMWVKSNLSLLC